MPQSWEVRDTGFWKEKPYVALANGYHYPEAKVLANHHIIIGEDDAVDTYIFRTHYYNTKHIIEILRSNGFGEINYSDKVLPESNDHWNGENVTFYTARKE